MHCPSCYTALSVADRAGIEIDFCPSCRGVWLDKGELDKIIERSSSYMKTSEPAPAAVVPSKRERRDYDDRKSKSKKRKKKSEWIEDLFDIFD
jgi:Zn-finger nucleic acid-binding protein